MKNFTFLLKRGLSLENGSGMTRQWLGIASAKSRNSLDSIVSRFSLASLICLCILTLGVGNAWGASTVTYTVTGKTSVSSSGTAPTSSSASYTQDYNTYQQLTSDKPNAKLTLSGYAGKKITGVVLYMKNSNSKKAAIAVNVGNSTIGSVSALSLSTSFARKTITITSTVVPITESVTITIKANGSSVWIQYFEITWEDGPSYTVNFSTGTGNPTLSARSGATFALPSTSDLTPTCSSDGWSLYSWATAAYSESTSAPTTTHVGFEGAPYVPTSATTLHAVYKKTEDDALTIGTVLWAENFGHFANNNPPSTAGTGSGTTIYDGASISYTQGTTSTKAQTGTMYAGGDDSPELLLASNNSWTISGIKTGNASDGYETNMTLTFKSNHADYLSISSSTSGVTCTVDPIDNTIWHITNTLNATTLNLTFSNTQSSNMRLDDVSLVTAGISTYSSTPSCSSCGVPTVGAPSNSSISVNTATVSCTGITKNDCDIAEWGFYYKTGSSGVTTSDTKHQVSAASSSTSVGSYSWDMTSLTANTHYYVKAYAIVDGVTTLSSSETDFTTCKVAAPNHVEITPTVEDGNYGYRYTIGETIKLTATAYASEGTGSPISSSNITGYQWQKYKGSAFVDIEDGLDATDGGTFSGTNSANLQISGCTSSNTGSYRCVINTGASCSKESSGYMVRVYTLDGNYYGSSKTQNAITWTNETTGTVTLSLNASSTYMFKVKDNDGKEYGREANNFIIEPWQQDCNTNNQDIRLFTGPAGTYTFTIDITNAQAGTPVTNVKVDYPDVTHPVTGYMYVPKWWTCYPHWWDGSGNALTSDGSDPAITKYTEICDEDYWYMPVLDNYVNVAVKDNATWASASNNSGNQTTTSHSGMLLTNNGSWVWEAFPTYTISFDKGAGSGTMSSITDITGGANQLLPANSFTKTGYDFDGWIADVDVKISGSTVTEGTKFSGGVTLQEICGNVALTAQWVANSYDVTLKKNGGASVADQVVSATYDSDMPLVVKTAGTDIVVPSRNGYTFQGYWDTSESSGGTQYYSYSGTPAVLASARAWDKTSATNLYGRWQANVYTVTLDNQSATTAGAASVSATFGQAMPSIASNLPAKTGYRFDGYYTDKNGGGTKYYNADGSSATNMAMYSANPKLYANWVAQLTFSVNGAIDDDLTRDVTEDIPSSATVPTSCGDCWAFVGWDASSTCSTTPGHAGGENAATHGITTPTTLYAVYGKAEYEWITSTSGLVDKDYYVLTNIASNKEYALSNTANPTYSSDAASTEVTDKIKENGAGYFLYNPAVNNIWKFTGTTSSGQLQNVGNTSLYLNLSGSGSILSTTNNLTFTLGSNGEWIINSTKYLRHYSANDWDAATLLSEGKFSCYLYHQTSATYATVPSCETYDIVWKVDDTPLATGSQTEETNTCTGIETLPEDPDDDELDCATKFVGWSEEELVGTGHDAPADLFTSVGYAPAIEEDKTFHAVFATGTPIANTYVLGTIDDLKDGQTVILVNYANDVACKNTSSSTGTLDALDISSLIDDDVLTTDNTAVKWTVTKSGDYYVFKSGDNYLRSSGASSLKCDGTSDKWSITSGSVDGTYYLTSYNGSNKFEYYPTNSNFTSYSGTGAYYNTVFYIPAESYSDYMTMCCDHIVTLSDGSPSNGSVTFDPVGPIETCTAAKEVSMTITPDPGYYLSAWTSSGVTPTSVDPAITTNNANAQTTTVTFAKETTEGTYTAGATFSAKALEGWTWMYKKDADAADGSVDPYAIPDVVEIYKDQYARFIITGYTPVDVIAAKQGYVYSAGGVEPAYSTDYLTYVSKNGSAPYSYYQLKGKAPTESTTITFKAVGDASITKTVTIRVKALPLAHFVDNVHNESFADVVATVTTGVVSLTKQTPTHDDVSDPGSDHNTCERKHLHLIGWIDGEWSPYSAYMNGTGDKPSITAITGATGYFYAPGADIDLVAKDGKTFYAVWAQVE